VRPLFLKLWLNRPSHFINNWQIIHITRVKQCWCVVN